MRKILPLLVVGIFVLSGLGAVAFSSNDETELITNSVSFSKPMIKNEVEYVTINIAETNSFIMKQGKPLLPSYVETFAFPFGTEIKSVTGTPKSIQTQTISKDVQPTPQAVIVGQIASQKESVDYGTEPYPANWFVYDVGCGLYDGELSIIVEIEFSPVKYYPAENKIDWANEVEIAIEYDSTQVKQPSRATYDLVIIAPDQFSDELSSLVTHKIGRGINTKFAGLTEVYGSTGRDNQEKIKYYIKDAIETWGTTNILLVGAWHDTDPTYQHLPARHTHVESTDPEDDEVFVSDLYYADIYDGDMNFCSWDLDGDSVFGELIDDDNIDGVDLHPDVRLGRIPSRNGGEVTTVVNKIKTYENNQAYTKAWFTDMVVVGGDTSPDYDCVEGEFINQKAMDIMGGFAATKLWVTNGKLQSTIPNGVTNIKNAISAGAGFVDFSGHGNTNVWATHEEGKHSWVPTPSGYIAYFHIQQTTNGNKLPIIAVEACSTAKFNKDDLTFNYAFLQNSGGGGIAAFGATALGWGYVGEYISQGLIGKMGLDTFRAYQNDDATTLGEMWVEALERYINPSMEALDFKTAEEWEPFGDPTLTIASTSTAPLKPGTPTGPMNGQVGTSYTYSASTTDPNSDQIYYRFEWGDGTYSSWVGPYNSGQTGTASKTWSSEGTFEVRVAAKDTNGKTSYWSNPLSVVMPRSVENQQFPFLQFILEYFPNAFPLLRELLGL
jgi:hypothetical protein